MPPDLAPPVADDADRVVLRVPADARYARVVRVAVSAFGVRLGLLPTAVGDLRLAVDEALILLLGGFDPDPDGSTEADVAVVLDVERPSDALVVELSLSETSSPRTASVAPGADDALDRFHELIPTGITVVAVDRAAGHVTLRRA